MSIGSSSLGPPLVGRVSTRGQVHPLIRSLFQVPQLSKGVHVRFVEIQVGRGDI